MKKTMKLILIICVALICFTLSSCSNKINFEDITIIGEDVSGLSEGAYTLRYKIENLEEYSKNNDVTLTVVVTDKNNNTVPITNNRIMQIEKDNEYLVTIMVSTNNGSITKTHNYTITAIKSPITVTFTSQFNNFDKIIKIVPYGGNLTDIPQVPEYTPKEKEGFTVISTKREWSVNNFTNLKQDLVVNAEYGIQEIRNTYTIAYQTYGGTEIPDSEIYYDYVINEPDQPSKDNCVFFGWYTDETLSERFTFSRMKAQNITVYARWLELVDDATPYAYFDFNLNTYDNNTYRISAKDKNNMPEKVVIPNIYNGKAVTMLGNFSQCASIKELYIPDTINEIQTFSLSGMDMLGNTVEMSLEKVFFAANNELITITEHAFSYCQNLTSINIPSSVKNLDEGAFYDCEKLNQITFDEESNLTNIREKAFYNCKSLQSIEFAKTVSIIKVEAFYNCILLESVILHSESPPIVESNVFYKRVGDANEKLLITFYVPKDSLVLYEEHSVFSEYSLLTND